MTGAPRHRYRVVVTRDEGDRVWLAAVPELQGAHTYARTLRKNLAVLERLSRDSDGSHVTREDILDVLRSERAARDAALGIQETED